MSEFNLIPASYQARLARQRMQQLAVVGAVAVVCIGAVAYFGLERWATHMREEVVMLEREQALSTRQRDTMSTLNQQKQELEQQWHLLETLRSGLPAKAMMETVQGALRGNEVWFLKWNLRRAGIVTEKETAPNQPGYFIIVKRKGPAEDWRSATHMTVTGQAWDHSQLSAFAQRLLDQPSVQDVRVQRTSQAFGRNRELEAVNFDLAIIFGAEDGQS